MFSPCLHIYHFTVDIIRLGDEDDDMIVGVAGNDYPTYAEVPDTSFR